MSKDAFVFGGRCIEKAQRSAGILLYPPFMSAFAEGGGAYGGDGGLAVSYQDSGLGGGTSSIASARQLGITNA